MTTTTVLRFFGIVALVAVVAFGIFSYHTTIKERKADELASYVYHVPFYYDDEKHMQALKLLSQSTVEYQSKDSVGDIFKNTAATAMNSLLEIADNENLPAKQRAYALNSLNVLYIGLNWDSSTFAQVFKSNQGWLGQAYQKHYSTYSNLLKEEVADTFRNAGPAAQSLAVQQTMVDINARSYSLYPTSYALLRQFLNQIQIDARMIDRDLVKSETRTYPEYIRDNYTKEEVTKTLTDLDKIYKEGRLTEGMANLGFQTFMMSGAIYNTLAILSEPKSEEYYKHIAAVFQQNENALKFISERGNWIGDLDMGMTQMFYISDLVNEAQYEGFDSAKGKQYLATANEQADKLADDAATNEKLTNFLRGNKDIGKKPDYIDEGEIYYGRTPFYQMRLLAGTNTKLRTLLESTGWQF